MHLIQSDPRAADTGGVGLSANSFADVYVEHMPEITRYCRSILRDPTDAEDAAQNAMERALKALADGPAPERIRPWLLTIAQRESINLLRLRRRMAPAELDESSLGPQGSAEELAAVRERLAELLADVRELSPRQREVLVARELGGRSYEQIAASMGTSVSAAQQLVLEARQSLRQFEAGRSLECRDVQAWISGHDHARVGTRRVRAHLRCCSGCRGFRTGIAARRRDFGLLLPGVAGGGAWWSWLAGAIGQGGAKLAAAGAVAVTGAAVIAGPALLDQHPNLPRLADSLHASSASKPAPPLLRSEIAVRLAAGPATDAQDRRDSTSPTAARRPRASTRRSRTPGSRATAPAPRADAAVAGGERASGRNRPDDPAPVAKPSPTAAPSPPSPVATPQALEPVGEAVKPVADALQRVTDAVDDAIQDVAVEPPIDVNGLLP